MVLDMGSLVPLCVCTFLGLSLFIYMFGKVHLNLLKASALSSSSITSVWPSERRTVLVDFSQRVRFQQNLVT